MIYIYYAFLTVVFIIVNYMLTKRLYLLSTKYQKKTYALKNKQYSTWSSDHILKKDGSFDVGHLGGFLSVGGIFIPFVNLVVLFFAIVSYLYFIIRYYIANITNSSSDIQLLIFGKTISFSGIFKKIKNFYDFKV